MAARKETRTALVRDILEIDCMTADGIEELTPEQWHAFHKYKFELIVGLHELYTRVPKAIADKVVREGFRQVGTRK